MQPQTLINFLKNENQAGAAKILAAISEATGKSGKLLRFADRLTKSQALNLATKGWEFDWVRRWVEAREESNKVAHQTTDRNEQIKLLLELFDRYGE